MVCLNAQTTESITSLNCGGGNSSSAAESEEAQQVGFTESLTWEACQVDSAQQFEEANTVLGELRKVLVNHIERRLEHRIQSRRDLRYE